MATPIPNFLRQLFGTAKTPVQKQIELPEQEPIASKTTSHQEPFTPEEYTKVYLNVPPLIDDEETEKNY
jgi:hypothetical protein